MADGHGGHGAPAEHKTSEGHTGHGKTSGVEALAGAMGSLAVDSGAGVVADATETIPHFVPPRVEEVGAHAGGSPKH